MKNYDYESLSLSDLINKIDTSRFFHLPKMVAEALRKLQTLIANSGGGGVESISGDYIDNTDPLNPILNDPRPYKVYTALLTQTGTDAPVATVLENTLGGDVTWTYDDIGSYFAITNGLFVGDVGGFVQDTNVCFRGLQKFSDSIVSLATLDPISYFTDGLLTNAIIEIRVYN